MATANRLRQLGIAVGAVFSAFSPRATEAQTTAIPPSATATLRAACGDGGMQIAGPWRYERTTYFAATVWREGAAHACLALVRATARGVGLVARGTVPAGYSERYGESYAPDLRATPLLLPGLPPFIITDATTMGHSGGGGSSTSVWAVRGGRWAETYADTLDGASDINSAVEKPCPSPAPVGVTIGKDGRPMLRVERCFDGVVETLDRPFDGQRFR